MDFLQTVPVIMNSCTLRQSNENYTFPRLWDIKGFLILIEEESASQTAAESLMMCVYV